jgi:acyl-CoA thioester hydrolase
VSDHRVALRWQDFDGLGHANHALFLTYFEEGRDAWLREIGMGREEYVVGRCTLEYKREIDRDQPYVVARCAAREIGRSSLVTAEQLLSPDGELHAEGEFGLVMWDPGARRSRPISPQERQALEQNMEART